MSDEKMVPIDHDVAKIMGLTDEELYVDTDEIDRIFLKATETFIKEKGLQEEYDKWFDEYLNR